jgi:hypothetical protein
MIIDKARLNARLPLRKLARAICANKNELLCIAYNELLPIATNVFFSKRANHAIDMRNQLVLAPAL